MWPEGLSNAVIIVHGQDGNNYILPEDIPSVEISELQYGEEFRNALLADSAECSINLRTKKGAIDHLFSKPTMAAYRYVRSERRKKEKERRQKLKEAAV